MFEMMRSNYFIIPLSILHYHHYLQYLNNLVSLEQGERDDYHQYKFGDQSYPGITGVLGKTKSEKDKQGLLNWKDGEPHHPYITEEAMMIGTQTHKLIEDYLNNKPTEEQMDLLSYAHFERMKKFLYKINNIAAIEGFLYSKQLRIAGTADCVAEYNGNLSIIDYKTKRSDQRDSYLHDYYLQCTAYAIMWEEMTGTPVNQIVILVSSRKGQLEEFIKNPNDFKDELKERLDCYFN